MKIHLAAHCPNEGARRIAWFLAQGGDPAWRKLERFSIGTMLVHRLIAGEVLPGTADSYQIFSATNGAVRSADWRSAADDDWFVEPIARSFDAVAFKKAA